MDKNMYYIMIRVKNYGRGCNRGEIWSTDIDKRTLARMNEYGDSIEKFLERECSELLGKVKSHAEVVSLMTKWHNFAPTIGHNRKDFLEVARKFFRDNIETC
jgi:hypothetical protein